MNWLRKIDTNSNDFTAGVGFGVIAMWVALMLSVIFIL
jgi:hypothetical protein